MDIIYAILYMVIGAGLYAYLFGLLRQASRHDERLRQSWESYMEALS